VAEGLAKRVSLPETRVDVAADDSSEESSHLADPSSSPATEQDGRGADEGQPSDPLSGLELVPTGAGREAGEGDARADLEAGRLRLLSGPGYPTNPAWAFWAFLDEAGIWHESPGCRGGPDSEYRAGYNEVMEEAIAEQHGPRFLRRIRRRANRGETPRTDREGFFMVVTPGVTATVYWNGRRVGETPVRVTLPLGQQRLVLEGPDADREFVDVDVRRGQMPPVSVDLT